MINRWIFINVIELIEMLILFVFLIICLLLGEVNQIDN
jgi:hypothetical protein